jgi:predicted small secreted protein
MLIVMTLGLLAIGTAVACQARRECSQNISGKEAVAIASRHFNVNGHSRYKLVKANTGYLWQVNIWSRARFLQKSYQVLIDADTGEIVYMHHN